MTTVETFLKSGPLSLSELMSALRTQSKDEKAHPVFSDSEIKLALRQAIINSHGKYFLTDTTEIEFVFGTYGPYTLPQSAHRVIRVLRERTSTVDDTHSVDPQITRWRQLRRRSGNELYFTRNYPDSTMTIWYETDVAVPIDARNAGAAHNAAVTALTLSDADPQLTGLEFPAYFKWDNEIVKITEAASNVAATMVRAQFGSSAGTHTNGSELHQLVVADSDKLYNFLFQESGKLLNEWRVQQGNQNVSVSANVTAAKMFKENREAILKEIPQPRRQRRMHFPGARRPRRRY
jgi:hypothetical protein